MKHIAVIYCCFSLSACNATYFDNKQAETVPSNKNTQQGAAILASKTLQKPMPTQPENQQKQNWQTGKVVFNSFEGGFYGVILHTGEKLLPVNLDKTYQQAGMVINIKGQYLEMATTQQWGKPFFIKEINVITQKNEFLKGQNLNN